MGADDALESELGLGELAGLTVANEADSLTYDVSVNLLMLQLLWFWIVVKLFNDTEKHLIRKEEWLHPFQMLLKGIFLELQLNSSDE